MEHITDQNVVDLIGGAEIAGAEEHLASCAECRELHRIWVQRLASLMRQRFPDAEVRLADTVCMPTKQRQQAAVDLARRSDVVIVIGGARSNNTRELTETCRAHCPRVFQVQTAADVRHEWLAGAGVVGLTAGTSTPDPVIDQVEARLRELSGGQLAA
jgi:4-hydroxy-3-methylbut-2-enyl diphosphate reductase